MAARIRKQFLMKLRSADVFAEYERAHTEIWPEMVDLLKAHGVHNYSIALDASTLTLFAYAEVRAGGARGGAAPAREGNGARKARKVVCRDRIPVNPQIESEERWAAIGATEVCQRWWQAMAPLMVVDGIRPVSTELREVFYMK